MANRGTFRNNGKSSVVKICINILDNNKVSQTESTGTAFLFSETSLMMTKAHIFPNDEGKIESIAVWQENIITSETLYLGQIPSSALICKDKVVDLAILQFSHDGNPFPYIPFGDTSTVEALEPVVVVSYTGSSPTAVFTHGVISSMSQPFTTGAVEGKRCRADAAKNPRSSGGPIYHDDLVIGVVSCCYNAEILQPHILVDEKYSIALIPEQNNTLFIPVHQVIKFLKENAPRMPTEISKIYPTKCEK